MKQHSKARILGCAFLVCLLVILALCWPTIRKTYRQKIQSDLLINNYGDAKIRCLRVVTSTGTFALLDIESHSETVFTLPVGTQDIFDVTVIRENGRESLGASA